MDLLLLADNPVDDQERDFLEFGRYLTPLESLLSNPDTETPFTVGIFGPWGSGKTSLLRLLESKLNTYEDRFVCVRFNPWIYRHEPNLLLPLLHTLHDSLDRQGAGRFKESAKRIAEVLACVGANVLLKALTLSTSVDDLEKLEARYRQAHDRVESPMRRLREALQKEADLVAENNSKLVLFVDDLDRCEPHQIVDLLEATKLFFDLRHVFLILALDQEVVERGIEIRYEKFRFAEGRARAIGAEYLEKMVQLPLQLFPLFRPQVGQFLDKLVLSETVQPYKRLLTELLEPNPRKIKRILNTFTVISHVAQTVDQSLQGEDLLRLVVLQVQSPDLFLEAARRPGLLLALEATYAGALRLNDPQGYHNEYGPDAGLVRKFCEENYRPGSYLPKLFEHKTFTSLGKRLPEYFAIFGESA